MSLPLVYAVTYHLSFSSMYTSEWLIISVFLSPLVLLFAGIRYGFARLKQQERQVMNKAKILEKCQNFSRIFIKPPNRLKFLLQLESLQHIVVGVFNRRRCC